MSTLDYEVELAVVIGRRCRNVRARDAIDYIAGYTICNDASIRERHHRSPTITLAKSFDSLGPLGPWLVTADEIADPHALRVRTWVNGELRQDGNTAEMRFNIFEQIEELSSAMTLEPGDVLATGTPAGIGAARQPPCSWRRATSCACGSKALAISRTAWWRRSPPAPELSRRIARRHYAGRRLFISTWTFNHAVHHLRQFRRRGRRPAALALSRWHSRRRVGRLQPDRPGAGASTHPEAAG